MTCKHLVHFQPDVELLAREVGRYLWDALQAGGGALVVARPEHNEQFVGQLRFLGANIDRVQKERRLVMLDGEETLARFMVNGQPECQRFEQTIRAALRSIRAQRQTHHTGLSVYGEMVGVLWQQGNVSAAIRLEQFWNDLQQKISFDLYCGYSIDGTQEHPALSAVVNAHTAVIVSDSRETKHQSPSAARMHA